MQNAVRQLFLTGGGYATTAELLQVLTRQQLDVQVRRGTLIRVWHGVYAPAQPDYFGKLVSLDKYLGLPAVACMGTAAALYGFDTEGSTAMHILDPGRRIRPTAGLVVHQRLGAPLQRVQGRLATSPAWTAVEIARTLRRPRALATLDAALHTGWCTTADLGAAVAEQCGRRGIVAVRELLPLADGRAESPMETEARLAMHEHDVPRPELQFLIHGRWESWRVDFAWPEYRVAAEYESIDWHAGRDAMLKDKARFAGIQHARWTVIPITVTDVRVHPDRLAERIRDHLWQPAAAG